MKSNLYKTNPKRLLGYIIAFAIVFLNYNTVNAQTHCTGMAMQYPSAAVTVPAPGAATVTISTCNYQNEHSQLTGIAAANTYTCENVTAGGWVTIYEGSNTGTFVAEGPSPLTWTSISANDHWVHWTASGPPACGQASGVCHQTQVSWLSASTNLVWGCTDSLALNYDTAATVNDGSCIYYMGCMDTLALNYDSLAVQDDGSCIYPCVSGYQEESFEDGLNGTIWENDASNNNVYGWLHGSYGTSSSNTGPSAAFDSTDYMYVETSGNNGNHYYLNSRCVDVAAYTDPALVFAYHMYGATMGTLSVEISTDTGASWTSVWALSGDQGDQWHETVVSLSGYSGGVYVRFHFLTGSSFTSDCAIDFARFMESPNAGCMDPFAVNYDSTATLSDNSCLFPGCMDPIAMNYSSTYNADCDTLLGGNNMSCCIYSASNSLDFCEDFESASLSTNGWTSVPGSAVGCQVQLTATNPIADTVSLEMTGADASAGWVGAPTSEGAAFANTSHVSSANLILDLSASTGPVDLTFDYKTESYYSSGSVFGGSVYSSMRVKVNGVVVSDVNGTSWHGSEDLTSLRYNLSSYAGQSNVTVTFESACRYGSGFSSGIYGDYVWIDNVCAFNVTPCTYYSANVASTAVTCNAGGDGSVSVTVSGMDTSFTYNNSYSWTDASSTIIGTSSTVSALTAGTYTCIVSDAVNGCSDTVSVDVVEPSPIVFTAVVTTSTNPAQSNGSVDITVGGGTPCATSVQVGSGTVSSYLHRLWYTYYHDGRTEITYLDTELAALGMNPGDVIDEFGWKILSQDGSAATWPMNGANLSINGTNVWSGTHQAVVGLNNFVLTTPYVYTGGHLVVEWCFDNTAYVSGNNYFECTSVPGSVISRYQDGAIGCALTGLINYDANRPNAYIGFQSASAYTFAWSNGATSEDVYNLPMGPIAVTVTDCDSCTAVWSGFIVASLVPGCTDSTAFNYNPSANVDDSSCIAVVIGCMDTTAFNYNPLANTNDSTLCVAVVYGCLDATAINYNPLANVSDSSCASCTGLQVAPYTQTFDSVGYINPLNQSVNDDLDWTQDNLGTSSFGTGPSDDITGGGYYMYTEASGSGYPNKTAIMYSECIDISQLSCPSMRFSYHMYGAAMGTLRVIVEGDTSWTMSGDQGNQWHEAQVDLSTYTGLIRIDFVGVTGTSYTSDIAIDQLIIDECIVAGCMDSTAYNYDSSAVISDGSCLYVMGCTDTLACNYDSLAVMDDGSCYILSVTASSTNVLCASDTNGTATATANAGGVNYLWSNGQTSATISGLSPGTYTCVVTDTLGCISQDSATVGSPLSISISSTVGNESTAGAADGQIDITVSGGVPCATTVQVGSGTVASYMSYLWYTWYMDGHTEITYPAAELAALGMNPGDIMDELAWNIITLGSGYTMNNAQMTVNGVVVYTGNYTPVVGMNNFVFSTPITYTGGDLVVEWCFDNAGYVSGNNMFESTMTAGTLSNYADYSVGSGCTLLTPTIARSYRPNAYIGFQAATGYTFAWSNGDSTEDISGLSAGVYCVTVTDCNGCIATLCDSVSVAATPGCMDPAATNYNPFASVDDGSCVYDCSQFSASASTIDASCNGTSDGEASVSFSGGSGTAIFSWDNGSSASTIPALSAGTYCCVVTDTAHGCVDTVCVTINEPAAIVLSAVVVDDTISASTGSIDLSVSGGTACATTIQVGTGTNISGSFSGSPNLFNTYWHDSKVEMTFQAAELSALGLIPGQSITSLAWEIATPSNSQMTNLNITVSEGSVSSTIHSGNYTAIAGWNTFTFTTPFVWNGGDLVVEHCFDNDSYTSANIYYYSVTSFNSVVEDHMDYGLGCSLIPDDSSASRPNTRFGTSASQYTFAWSTGDITEDISGLSAGTYSVTATDCNGCAETASYTVGGGSAILGCMDSTAYNYNPLATIDDSSCVATLLGCTDSTAMNYYAAANTDDGSCLYVGCNDPTATNYSANNVGCDSSGSTACCTYATTCGAITGINMSDVIHDRATFNWNDMNGGTANCVVDQIRIRYRELGTSTYFTKTMGAPVGNNAPCLNTSKRVLGLSPSTTYEYDFKIWYQDGTVINWHGNGAFTTAPPCNNVINVTVTPLNNVTKANFCWTAPASTYSFVRLKYREDVPGSTFSNIGGMGVMSPTLCKEKNGITPGLSYRVMWRTWCNPTGGPYRSAGWDGPVLWTQPSSVRVAGGTAIANLDVYPNPSRDIFNVSFTSEDVQNLDIRIVNLIGEVVYTENLEQFVGQYTKQVDLTTYTKGIYFLEITTDNGVVNKKLILQ